MYWVSDLQYLVLHDLIFKVKMLLEREVTVRASKKERWGERERKWPKIQ